MIPYDNYCTLKDIISLILAENETQTLITHYVDVTCVS